MMLRKTGDGNGRPNRRIFALVAICLALGVSTSAGCCTMRGPPITSDAYPWRVRAASELNGDFLWRQSMKASFRGRGQEFDAVLQKKGDTLTLLGLTPMGTKAFVLTQTGTEISFESFIDRELPFPPRFMLIDVQRSYFPIGAPPATDSTITTQVDGETVEEVWQDGVLRRRTFTRIDGKPEGTLTIDYRGWDGGAPVDLVIDNPWFGYTMEIKTTSAQTLPQ